MIPIQNLLHRIRWDEAFGKGDFEIGYEDHIRNETLRVPFRKLQFEEGNAFSFQVESDTGEILTIPFHRVREVYRNGLRIWHRPG